jgi:CBS domain containing-hemolysin-like protein
MMNAIDDFVGNVAGVDESQASAEIEDQILSAVQEGADQGIVDPEEKEMIESVIQFRDHHRQRNHDAAC